MKKYMDNNKRTAYYVAKQTGLTTKTIYDLLNGRSNPTARTMDLINAHLDG